MTVVLVVLVVLVVVVVVGVLVVLVAGDEEEEERRRRVFVADVLQRADAAGDREDLRERAARWRELG